MVQCQIYVIPEDGGSVFLYQCQPTNLHVEKPIMSPIGRCADLKTDEWQTCIKHGERVGGTYMQRAVRC